MRENKNEGDDVREIEERSMGGNSETNKRK
jgi:hypothetical protein